MPLPSGFLMVFPAPSRGGGTITANRAVTTTADSFGTYTAVTADTPPKGVKLRWGLTLAIPTSTNVNGLGIWRFQIDPNRYFHLAGSSTQPGVVDLSALYPDVLTAAPAVSASVVTANTISVLILGYD